MKRQVFIRSERVLGLTVMVTALGYFIDMFDLLIFNMVRMESLGDLGLSGQEITEAGLFVSNAQFGGFILGAWISGVLGDKFGRKRTLYFSILVYSAGSLACAFVQDVPSYALARFITGLGLAGELGAGISLISERLDHTRRGTGVMVLIGMGFLGVVAAALVSEFLPWRTVYIVGGVLGLALLVTRSLLSESM
ncbi:MAG: MFS transporter, partial [Alphaproteobacteria bacterium]|nr:MFS transporter [Alphaproteobacteria bacterium]